jgi:hypothetical protein
MPANGKKLGTLERVSVATRYALFRGPPTLNLSDLTAPSPSASFTAFKSRAERSSSSFAQTAERQATVTTPPRSETGSASAAISGPAAAPQHLCTRASVVAGAARSITRASASEIGRGSL